MNDIFISHIDKSEKPEDYFFLMDYLPPERVDYILKKQFDTDRLRSLKGDWMIRRIIRDKFGLDYKDIEIKPDQFLKPFVIMPAEFYFNISHSGDYIACIISDRPCGIDIEKKVDIDTDELVSAVFNRKQIDYINERSSGERLDRFYSLWTIKESFIKAIGKGFKIDVKNLDFDLERIKIISENIEWKKFKFEQHSFDENYKLTSCVCDRKPCKKINYIEKTFIDKSKVVKWKKN